MRMLRISTAFLFLLIPVLTRAQVFWTENFNNGCTASCTAASYTGSNGAWTSTNTGMNGADANIWYVSCAENGHTNNVCGSGCVAASPTATLATLHVGSAPTSMGDVGAAYDAGGLCGFWTCPQTNKRAESPVINCTGKTNITVSFNYIENGDGTIDDATFWYNAGSGWVQIVNLPKTLVNCAGGQGRWTTYTTTLPAACDNNSNVRIGFNWTNNDDGAGSDPSFAVDDITLSVASSPQPVAAFTPSSTSICAGACISFTDNTTNTPTAWSWSFPSAVTTSSTAQNPANICFNIVGTYTVTLTASNASGSSTAIQTITVNPNPTITVTPASPSICAGGNVALTASGATTYTWSPATGLSATTGSTVNASPSATQVYTVTGTLGTCIDTENVTVTVTPNPTITVTPASPSICAGGNVALTASGATTYTWSPATGLSATTGSLVNASPPATQVYTVTGTLGTCIDTENVTVTVTPNPTITVTPASPSICTGGNVALTASGATSYTWSPATGLSSTTGSTVTASPTVTTTYSVIGTTGTCADTNTVIVTVDPLPAISVTPAAPAMCPGDNVSLTASGAATYTWSPAIGLSATTGATVTASPASTTAYTVTGTSAAGCINTQTVTVTVANSISVTLSPSSASICAGDSVSITASGATSYTWSPATGLSATTGSSVNASPASTATYSVIGTSGTCADTNTVTITVAPSPTVTVTSASTSICSGSSEVLTASGATSYTWSPATGLSATTGSSVTASPTSTITYSVVGTSGSCLDSSSITITVAPTPTVSVSPASTSVCAGDSASITASGAISFTWSPATGLSATTGSAVNASPSSTTTYSVIGTDGACSDTNSVMITVTPPPIVSVVSSSPTLCSGSSVTLTASGGTNYTWSPATGLSATTGSSVTASPSSTITYSVIGETGTCTDTTTITVTVAPSPTVTATPASPTICAGNSVSITASGAASYTWSPGTGLSATTGSTVTASPSSTTSYSIIGSDGTCADTISITVTVDPCSTPVAAFTASQTSVCEGSCVNFTDQSTNTTSWIWSFPGGTPSTSTAQNPTVCYTSAGAYDVTLIAINSSGGDTSVQTNAVTVGAPSPVDAGNDVTVYIGNSADLSATGNGPTFSWEPPTGLSCTACQSPAATPLATTAYIVTMTDDNGCVTTDTVVVIVEEKYEFFMPTGFSPNGDGVNDVLYVRGNGIQWIKLLVFDRVGEKVWETHSTTNGWDGTFRGAPMNSGVFVYYLEVQFYSGQHIKKEGDITLVK